MGFKDKREIVYEKEDAYKTLEIINSWINAMDTKASFLLAYIAVIMGFVFTSGIPHVFEVINASNISFLLIIKLSCVVLLYFSLLTSIILYFETLQARIKNEKNRHSLLFFGEIASISLNDFKAKILNRTEEELIKDILEQIHTNSLICKRKSRLFNGGIITTIIATLLYVVSIVCHLL